MPARIASHQSNAKLRALHPDISPEEYALDAEACLIGRQPSCQVVVPLSLVSRVHARVERRAAHYVLIDAGSANGTFVNGARVFDEYVLRNQDAIGLANRQALLQFIDQDTTDLTPRTLQYLRHEQRFTFKGVPLDLSPNLRRLLLHLHAQIGRVCTHESCFDAIWPGEQHGPERIELLHREVSELRQKFRAIDSQADVIKVRRGVGYYLEPEL